MKPLEFKQSSHLNPQLINAGREQLSDDKLIGRWVNTDHETKGIAECVIAPDGDRYRISIFGVGENGMLAWSPVAATTLANFEEEAGQRTIALVAGFDLAFMRVETHIRLNKGVLVIVLFNTFTDDSGRANYLNREFFCRRD